MPATATSIHKTRKKAAKKVSSGNDTKHYTYADYLKLNDGNRYEVLNGKLRKMTPPAPSIPHQQLTVNIVFLLKNILKEKIKDLCKLLVAPVDVVFPEKGKPIEHSGTVLQPDLIVVCDDKKITENYVVAPPDFVVEIVSPSSAKYDLDEKFKIYEQAGVREYWVVFPKDKIIQDYVLKDGKFQLEDIFTPEGPAKVQIFDIELDTKEIFDL